MKHRRSVHIAFTLITRLKTLQPLEQNRDDALNIEDRIFRQRA